VRKETRLLDHVAEPATQRDRVLAANVAPEREHVTRVVIDEAVDDLQSGRLPAAGRSDECECLAFADREGQPIQNGATRRERLADVAELDDGNRCQL
jgi:hypothetical protein